MTDQDKNVFSENKSEEDKIKEFFFGSDEEIDDETAKEILDSYNVSSEELVNDFKLKLQEELRQNYDKPDKDGESKNLANVLKDINNYQRAKAPKEIEPKSSIKDILNGIFNLDSSQTLVTNYRNKEGKTSQSDEQILDDLESELDKE